MEWDAAPQIVVRLKDCSLSGAVFRPHHMVVHKAQAVLSGTMPPAADKLDYSSCRQKDGSLFGVSRKTAAHIETLMLSAGPFLGLVGHRHPDFDCLACLQTARYIASDLGIKTECYVDEGRAEQLNRRMVGFSDNFRLMALQNLPPQVAFILFDALDSRSSNVNAPSGCTPMLVIDTHHGPSNGAETCISENHNAASALMLGVLFHHLEKFPPKDSLRAHELRRVVTLAFLGIMTDTAELRRATPYEIDAVEAILPSLDPDLLRQFQNSSFNRETNRILREVEELSSLGQRGIKSYCHRDGYLLCCLGSQPNTAHDAVAAAADAITFQYQGIPPTVVLLTYYNTAQQALVGCARVDKFDPGSSSINLDSLLKTIFGANCGTRGGDVGGGRILQVRDLAEAARFQRQLEAAFFSRLQH